MKLSIGLALLLSTLVSAGPVIRRAKGTQCAIESAPAASSSADSGDHHSYVPHNGGWGHHGGHHQSSWSWSWGSEPSSTGSEDQPEPSSSEEPSSLVDVPQPSATSASESAPLPSEEPSSSAPEPTSTEPASSSEAEPSSIAPEPSSSSEAEPTSTKEPESTSTEEPETSSEPTSTKEPEASSTPSPTSGSGSGNDSEIEEYLTGHNDFRAKHGADPLTWSTELASTAQAWADKCVFEHSGGEFGENLAAGSGDYSISSGIEAWTSESADYDPSNPQYSHFTQVVWKSTTELGCAYQMCDGIFDASYGKAKFIVCEYNPAGNYIGEFDENVQA